MAKMVITSNICIFFILKLVSKIVLDYLFFIDKSKSNRRRYRKGHNFLYKFFTGYVYSKKHMNESRCRNYIRVSGKRKCTINSDASDWQTYFNGKTGWVCIGNPDCNSKSKGVEFAKNTVAVIDNEQLSSIWIKPQFI